MGNVKLHKLHGVLEREMGTQKNFTISAKKLNVTISGELHKYDDHCCFTKGVGKVVIAEEKAGRLFSWRGTYKKYVVRFMIGNETLAEFDLPENAKLRLDDLEQEV